MPVFSLLARLKKMLAPCSTAIYYEGCHVTDFYLIVFAQPVMDANSNVVDAELFAIYLRRGKKKGWRKMLPNPLQTPFLKVNDWRYMRFDIRFLDKVNSAHKSELVTCLYPGQDCGATVDKYFPPTPQLREICVAYILSMTYIASGCSRCLAGLVCLTYLY